LAAAHRRRPLGAALFENREQVVDVLGRTVDVPPVGVRTHPEVLGDGHVTEEIARFGDVDEPTLDDRRR
jgi:hypothetical protein